MKMADSNGQSDKFKAFVDLAMDDYDLHGWTNDKWINEDEGIDADLIRLRTN